MKRFFTLLLLFFSATIWAAPASTNLYLRGVVLVDSYYKVQKGGVEPTIGLQAKGVKVPGGIEELKKKLEPLYLSKPITSELLMSLRSSLSRYYAEHKRGSIKVKLPIQDFSNGVVQIIVEEEHLIPDRESAQDEEAPLIKEVVTPVQAPPKKQKAALVSRPLVPHLTTLILVPESEYVGKAHDEGRTGIHSHNLAVPGGISCLTENLTPFLYECLTQELIQSIKKSIICYYRDRHHPVVTVMAPEQDITDGVLYLVVMDGKVGEIRSKGHKNFPSSRYVNAVRLRPGRPIDTDVLLSDVAWLNRNPFRKVDVCLSPGEEVGVTDIELDVVDRFPIEIYGGTDNTGTEPTGRVRWFGGFTWGNAFLLDHVLTYQYTASPQIHQFNSHTFHYLVPLHRHILRAFGGYATIHPDIGEGLHSVGHTFQGSVRYTAPFGTNYNGALQEITLGFDYKNTDNNLIFVGEDEIALITKTVNLTQFVAGYALGRENDKRKFLVNLDLYFSPATFVNHQTETDFSNLNPHSKPKYVYGKLGIIETFYLPRCFELFFQGRFQLANQVLLQSEEFGLGGYDTVRGYEEREFNADNAICTNVEIHSPSVSIINFFTCRSKHQDRLYFLLFFDYGLGNVNHRGSFTNLENLNPKISKTEYLMSVGPGFRYTINSHLSARLDWGVKLHRTTFSDDARSKFHFGFILNF